MEIVVTRTDEGKYFANVFDSRPVLMTRIPVDKAFSELEPHVQYTILKEKYPDLMKRIR